jgi:hypothetical protein
MLSGRRAPISPSNLGAIVAREKEHWLVEREDMLRENEKLRRRVCELELKLEVRDDEKRHEEEQQKRRRERVRICSGKRRRSCGMTRAS